MKDERTIYYNCDTQAGVCVYKLNKRMDLGIRGSKLKSAATRKDGGDTLYGVC